MIDWDSMLPGIKAAPKLDATPMLAPTLADDMRQRGREWDNRRRCIECGKHAPNGRCLAAAKGEIVASSSYQPDPLLLRRCEGFAPLPDDPDQRSGWGRWPGLPGTHKR